MKKLKTLSFSAGSACVSSLALTRRTASPCRQHTLGTGRAYAMLDVGLFLSPKFVTSIPAKLECVQILGRVANSLTLLDVGVSLFGLP